MLSGAKVRIKYRTRNGMAKAGKRFLGYNVQVGRLSHDSGGGTTRSPVYCTSSQRMTGKNYGALTQSVWMFGNFTSCLSVLAAWDRAPRGMEGASGWHV